MYVYGSEDSNNLVFSGLEFRTGTEASKRYRFQQDSNGNITLYRRKSDDSGWEVVYTGNLPLISTLQSRITWNLLGFATGSTGATILNINISDSLKYTIHELFIRVKFATGNNATTVHYKYSGTIIAEDFIAHPNLSHNYLFGMNNGSGQNVLRNNCIVSIGTNFSRISLNECYFNGLNLLESPNCEFRVWYR